MKISTKPLKKSLPASKRPAARKKLEELNKKTNIVAVVDRHSIYPKLMKEVEFLRKDARVIRKTKIVIEKFDSFYKIVEKDFLKITNTKLKDYLNKKYNKKDELKILNENGISLDTLFMITLKHKLYKNKEEYEKSRLITKVDIISKAINETHKEISKIGTNYSSVNSKL